jgi:hypothetical protein
MISALKDLYHTAKQILSDPITFFGSVKKDEGYRKPWEYYAKLTAIYMLVSMIASIPVYMSLYSTDPELAALSEKFGMLALFFTMIVMLITFAIIYAIVIGIVFAVAGVTHLFMLAVGASKGYLATFKIVCYGTTPIIFIAPFAFLDIYGDIGSAIFIMISLALSLYVMVMEMKGAMIIHELSKGRAFVGMIVLPVILMVAVFVMLLVFYGAAYSQYVV